MFDAANSGLNLNVIPPGASGIGVLGTFTHENFPITPPTLQSIQLRVYTDIAVNQGAGDVPLGNFQFLFDFTHDETPNGGVPGGPFTGTCPYSNNADFTNGVGVNVNGCADRVTVSALNNVTNFTIGTVHYTLTILGFSSDGCATNKSSFLTTESLDEYGGYLRAGDGDREPSTRAGKSGTGWIGVACGGLHPAQDHRLDRARQPSPCSNCSQTGPSFRSGPFFCACSDTFVLARVSNGTDHGVPAIVGVPPREVAPIRTAVRTRWTICRHRPAQPIATRPPSNRIS